MPYGCEKPDTTSVKRNFELMPGTHDEIFSQVRFEGATGTGQSTSVLNLSINPGPGHDQDVHDIMFDRCVFATLPPGIMGNGIHFWNYSKTGKTWYRIFFNQCWFEPQPRMQIELNGRDGWWHDVVVDRCTFEPSCRQNISFTGEDRFDAVGGPYGVLVDGVRRGVEGLVFTNNDVRGNGVVVNGFGPYKDMMFELTHTFAAPDGSGRCKVEGNRFGRGASAWLNLHTVCCYDVDFAENLFDMSYNPAGIAVTHDNPISGAISRSTFRHNTYILDSSRDANHPYVFIGCAGDGNRFYGERWIKTAGSIGSTCSMPFTNSRYYGCEFTMPKAITFPSDAVGIGCKFNIPPSGGTFVDVPVLGSDRPLLSYPADQPQPSVAILNGRYVDLGTSISWLEWKLNQQYDGSHGHPALPPIPVTGEFDETDQARLLVFQNQHYWLGLRLPRTGKMDSRTWRKLISV